MRIILYSLLIFVSFQISYSQTQLWIDREGRYSYAYSITADNESNVCVTGNCLIDTFSGGSQSMAAIKYNTSGNRIWTFFGGLGLTGTIIKSDSMGSFYVGGFSASGIITWKINSLGILIWKRIFRFPQMNSNNPGTILSIDKNLNIYVAATGQNKINLIKYDLNGNLQWANSFGINFIGNKPYEIVFDESQNVYLACNMNNQFSVAKFNTNGDSLWCTQVIDIGDHGDARSLKIKDNNLYATGTIYILNYGNEMLTLKCNLNGKQLWRQRFRDQNYHRSIGEKLVIDNTSDCVVVGESDHKIITLKYDTSGVLKWFQKYSIGPDNFANSVAVDKYNSIYLSGYGNIISNLFNFDCLTLKYSSEGILSWASRYSGEANNDDISNGLVLDKIGGVYVTGMSTSNNFNIITIKYSSVTGVSTNLSQIPDNFSLSQNYPNPFNPNTVIRYKLSFAGNISLNVYDANGRLIKILERGYKTAGNYQTNFSAEGLSSGIYYYRLSVNGVLTDTKKMILLK